ncbi:TIR domain-containing protein [Roseovarius sp.]|uniref:TIR domain-containing protein n=1 Tax=Roseovarius sp. TaxID=1486281 RepID=UPI003D0E8FDD
MKFHGDHDELVARFEAVGLTGDWQTKPNNCFRLVTKTKGGVNWSANKGTLWFDGPPAEKAKVEKLTAQAIEDGEGAVEVPDQEKSTVFVVHGHDSAAREQLELVLHKLGLDPFVLQNSDGGGLTIIESLEKMIGKNAESSFGIVLMTPDDMGYAKSQGEEETKPRARQNVVLEMGMLLASLTRDRVVILQKGFVETPSDVAGIIYLGFNEHVKETIPKLVGRLQKAGFEIPAEKVAAASS